MKSQYVNDRLLEISRVSSRTSVFGAHDPELASYLSSYLAVFISGVYEDCIEHLFLERAERGTDPEVHNYVKSTLAQTFRNPTFQRIAEILTLFSRDYAHQLRRRVNARAQEAITSIVNNKNKVAHGETSNATLSEILDYHNNSYPILDIVEEILS